MATERKAPGASGPHIPDLEVRPKAPSTAAPSLSTPTAGRTPSKVPETAARAPSSVHDYFGSGTFDPEHFGDVGGSALETSEGEGAVFSASFAGEQELSGAGEAIDFGVDDGPHRISGRPAARASLHAWPTGRSPDPTALVVDPVDVRLAADYGRAPANVIQLPVYTVRVVRRRSELEANVKRLAAVLDDHEARRDALLVATALEIRGKALLADGGEDLFAPVVEVERLALERRSSLAGTNAEYDRRAREIDDGAEALERDAVRKDSEVDQAGQMLAKQRGLLERAVAKKKRLYIEIRAIMDTAEKSGGAFSASQSQRIAELEAAVAAHNPEVEQLEKAVGAAEAVLEAVQGESKQLARRLVEAGRVRRALDDEFRKQIGVRSEGVEESERERAGALAEAMRKILAGRGRVVDVPKEALDGIARADRAVHASAFELEKFVRALDSYDKEAYRKGRVVIGVTMALLISLVVVLVARL